MFQIRNCLNGFLLVAALSSAVPNCRAADGALKVSPSDELLVIDPSVDSRGRPSPQFIPGPADGTQRIEIPPTVIVHRYYYTGDRNFQGPMLPGGPSVVVLNHPRTGEQVSVQAQLLPGAPRISYTADRIQYHYNDRTICLVFGHIGDCPPKVVYQRSPQVAQNLAGSVADMQTRSREFVQRTGVTTMVRNARQRTHDSVLALGDRINDLGPGVIERISGIADSMPAQRLFTPRPLPSAATATVGDATGIVNELQDTVPALP